MTAVLIDPQRRGTVLRIYRIIIDDMQRYGALPGNDVLCAPVRTVAERLAGRLDLIADRVAAILELEKLE